MKTPQDIAEENWCEMVGLPITEENKLLAPVIAGDWEPEEPKIDNK